MIPWDARDEERAQHAEAFWRNALRDNVAGAYRVWCRRCHTTSSCGVLAVGEGVQTYLVLDRLSCRCESRREWPDAELQMLGLQVQ